MVTLSNHDIPLTRGQETGKILKRANTCRKGWHMNEKLISGKAAAELLGVSQAYLYKLMKQGKLHRVQMKKTILKSHQPLFFQRTEVLKLLEDAEKEDEPA